jgi:hypothetical protein
MNMEMQSIGPQRVAFASAAGPMTKLVKKLFFARSQPFGFLSHMQALA